MCLVEHLASCASFNPLFELSIHARPEHMLAGTLQACSLALMMHIDVFLDLRDSFMRVTLYSN